MSNSKVEKILIKEIKNDNQESLKKLTSLYYPIIQKIKHTYFVRDFDDKDWYQEAMIVCYKSALIYEDQGKNFGGFFKKNFKNHVLNIVRYNNAKKRQNSTEVMSLDEFIESGQEIIPYNNIPEHSDFDLIDEEVDLRLDKLSNLELNAFEMIIGVKSEEDIMDEFQISEETLKRAGYRVMHKMRKFSDD